LVMKKKEFSAYLKRKDITIEGSTATWELAAQGDIMGLYTGQFKFRCYLTPTQKLAAGRLYRTLLGDHPTTALTHEDNMSFTLAQLKYRVISGPPFWESAIGLDGIVGDIPDEKILDIIFEAAVASELKYLATLQQKKTELIEKAKKSAEKLLKDEDEEEPEGE